MYWINSILRRCLSAITKANWWGVWGITEPTPWNAERGSGKECGIGKKSNDLKYEQLREE